MQARSNKVGKFEFLFIKQAGVRSIHLRSWRELRDNDVIKQSKDYSCGSAAVATILSYYYGRPTDEQEVLTAIGRGDSRATFLSMQEGLVKLGFRGIGVAVNFEQLRALQMPVIVHLRYRDNDHFTVVRGVGTDTIALADSSLGDRTFSNAQFRKMWETEGEGFPGKFLAILPINSRNTADLSYFKTSAMRQTSVAKRLVVFTAAGR